MKLSATTGRSDPPPMKSYRIAAVGGDGIGPEVVAAGVEVLRAVEARLMGVRFELRELSVGAGEYLKNGDPLPTSALEQMKRCDAILLGAMGLPGVRWPNGVEMTPQIDIREKLDLYNGVRPIRLYHALHTPLKKLSVGQIDLVLVRENCEGLFYARLAPRTPSPDRETDTLMITRRGSERICRAAFQLALKRRRHVTLVDKANVLPSMVFFRRVFDDVALQFPTVTTERIYVDAMALFLVQRPQSFDVIVTENIFGDILSELAAGTVGGMGMAPSADLGDYHGLFQPSHGAAPSIAGRGVANPIATILSVAMMLDWLGAPETVRGAGMIKRAVQGVLARPANRTADLGGKLTTDAITQLVIAALTPAKSCRKLSTSLSR